MNDQENTETTAAVDPAAAPNSAPADRTRVVRDGIFVTISTSIRGNVDYQRVDVVSGEKLDDGTVHSKWITEKYVKDQEEMDRAVKVRGAARGLVEKLCRKTALGLWCSHEQKGALNAARDAAEAMIAEFNRTADVTRISMFVIPTRMESDDTRALRDITREVSSLVQQMQSGVEALDADQIRKAANEARELSSMLSEENKTKVNAAVAQARKAARTITKRLAEEGVNKATILLDIQRGQIEAARVAFIDMEEQLTAEVLPAVQQQRFADLDLDDDSASDSDSNPEIKTSARNLDLDESELKMAASPRMARSMMEV